MLNQINRPIVKLFAKIQNELKDNQACETAEQERAFMVAGGKDRIYFNQLATRLTGNLIHRVSADVVEEQEITVYPIKAKRGYTQSLNGSLYMVAAYSVLMSGYTSKEILETSIINWIGDDSVNVKLDCKAVAMAIVNQFIIDGILSPEFDTGQLETGERFQAHPVTQEIQELRERTIIEMWDKAPPKMKPMIHPVTWSVNGTCELKNLTFKEQVKQHFVDSLNIMGHTGYKVNAQIKRELKRNLKKGLYDDGTEAQQTEATVKSMLALDTNKVYYFPHTPDYRGRVYARGGMTTFQGIKDLRAAFDFAETVTADKNGLFLHIANAYGKDKLSLIDRYLWVGMNHEMLMNTKADTLYAERARLAYIEFVETGKSNIVCRIDGTCSGVQITSGLFLDANTANAVNVCKSLPEDTPSDLYNFVAEAALDAKGRESDKTMIRKYGRNLTKKVIMILAYGAGKDTLIDTIKAFLLDNEERTSNAKAIYALIMSAINKHYPSITKLNNDLQIELQEKPHHKIVYKLSDITVKIKATNSEHLNLYGSNYTAKLVGKFENDSKKLARGIAPNFVHSLDSEMLRIAVVNLNTDVSCIHDDIGVQSNQVSQALQAIRNAYYTVIKAEPLKELYRGMGILEEYEEEDNGMVLADMLESTYMFS